MSHYRLWCYVAGGFTYFSIMIDPSKCLDDLKELILNEQKHRFSGVNGDGLILFQVRHPAFCVVTDISLSARSGTVPLG